MIISHIIESIGKNNKSLQKSMSKPNGGIGIGLLKTQLTSPINPEKIKLFVQRLKLMEIYQTLRIQISALSMMTFPFLVSLRISDLSLRRFRR